MKPASRRPSRKAARNGAYSLADEESSTPTIGIGACCARVARGHVAAEPPISVRKSRRLNPPPNLQPTHLTGLDNQTERGRRDQEEEAIDDVSAGCGAEADLKQFGALGSTACPGPPPAVFTRLRRNCAGARACI